MVQQTYLVITEKVWNINNFQRLLKTDTHNSWWMITHKDYVCPEEIDPIQPRYIFIPHWSWLIPKDVYEKYECVAFHMTDLPYGRGAEPLQHLIARGLTETMICAFRVSDGIDTGPIYLKRPMSLYGSAEEIYMRCSDICFQMIQEIISTQPEPIPQVGVPVDFVKRTFEDCRLHSDTLQQAYDQIRAQDADTYQKTFLDYGNFRLEFSRASLKHECIIADVKIVWRIT